MWSHPVRSLALQLAFGGFGYVQERTKGPGREKRVACAGKDSRRAWKLVGETPDKRGLSHAGLAAD
jgi:hypothetical protein